MSPSKLSSSRKGSLLAWGALALVVALIVLLGVLPRAEEALEAEEERPLAVRVMVVEPRAIADVVRLPGRIEPLQQALLPAERAGRVVERLADKGDVVEAGQVLLRVDTRLWETAQRRAQIEARDAERDLARWRELEKTGAVSASEYEAILRRQEAAAIALEETEVFLEQCTVRAPFNGVLTERFVETGDYANEGQAVFRLARLDRVKVAFDVPERDVRAVQLGQEMPFTLAALPGLEWTGRAVFVASQASPESNSFAVELEADNADGALKAGMIAQVSLQRQMREDAVVIPLAAVVPHRGEHYVFVTENGRAVRRRVLIGALIGHEAVLDAGLSVGERVVIEGHRGLQDGMLVDVQGEGIAPPEPEDPPAPEDETESESEPEPAGAGE